MGKPAESRQVGARLMARAPVTKATGGTLGQGIRCFFYEPRIHRNHPPIATASRSRTGKGRRFGLDDWPATGLGPSLRSVAVAGVKAVLEESARVVAALGGKELGVSGVSTSELLDGRVQAVGQVVSATEIEAEIDVSCVVIAGAVNGNINARGRCDMRAPGVIVGNICSPIVTMEEGVRFDGAMQMHHVLEEAIRARTQRAPGAFEGLDSTDEDDLSAVATGRIEAPATRDPSDLLDPENI